MDEIDILFRSYKLNQIGMDKVKMVAELFTTCLHAVQEIVPAGRELSIVQTKLQEACFFANRGIAVNPNNQQ